MNDKMTPEENITLLILDENHTMTDSVNPKQNMEKFMKALKDLGPELVDELSSWQF
jgi:hypothetical protein